MSKKAPIINLSKVFRNELIDIDSLDYLGNELVLKNLEPILNTILENPKTGRNYSIDCFFIKFVIIIENYARDLAVKIIDYNNLDVNKLFDKGEFTTNINTINEIKKEEFTIGRLIASNFNFQNPKEINFVFSKLLSINLFEMIKKIPDMPTIKANESVKTTFEKFIQDWDGFLTMFELRNQIAHSLRPIEYNKYDDKFFSEKVLQCAAFLISLGMLVKWCVFIKKGNNPVKDQLDTYQFFKKLLANKK